MRQIIYGILVGIMLCGLAGPVQAQEEDDELIILNTYTEVFFPSAVRFFVSIDASPDEIESVDLTVSQEGTPLLEVTLDPTEDAVGEPGDITDLAHLWLPGDEASPEPFSSLDYKWEIELTDGRTDSDEGEAPFVDYAQGIWEESTVEPLTLHWHNVYLAGRQILLEVMPIYELIREQSGRDASFEFIIYDPFPEYCPPSQDEEIDYPCSEAAYGAIYREAGMIFVSRPTLGYAELVNLLGAIISSELYGQSWGTVDVPAWFDQGLGGFYARYADIGMLSQTRWAAQTDTLFTLDEMSQPLDVGATIQERTLWQAEATMLVMYLAERYGADAPVELATSIASSGSFETALQDLTGESLEAFWDNWNLWLISPAAERVTNWTPYVPTTPTPTPTTTPGPTLTASPVPPTATITLTPTETIEPTSTFAADQPVTAVVAQVSPSATIRRTNTPLPPGSLNPTSAPSTLAEEEDSGLDIDPVVLVSAIILGGLTLVLLIMVLTTIMRRR